MPTIFGMLRIKNEARWIDRVLKAIVPHCERIFVMDDHSTDGTPEFCRAVGEKVTVWASPFDTMDESRDKQWMLDRMALSVPDHHLAGDPCSPYWALAIDGDEEMTPGSAQFLRAAVHTTGAKAWRARIPFLWNSPDTVRIDGVYSSSFLNHGRPSLFRMMNRNFGFLKTPWGNGSNFHCSSIPQELLGSAMPSEITLKHWGYLDPADRIRKWDWYSRIDPHNDAEDWYRHMIQEDVAERVCPHCQEVVSIPVGKLMHAGPLALSPAEEVV
jgi:hypothetical protein